VREAEKRSDPLWIVGAREPKPAPIQNDWSKNVQSGPNHRWRAPSIDLDAAKAAAHEALKTPPAPQPHVPSKFEIKTALRQEEVRLGRLLNSHEHRAVIEKLSK
jgi:hypothetical protein